MLCGDVTRKPLLVLACILTIFNQFWQSVALSPKVHFITTAKDDDGPYPCSSIRSALSRGLDVTIIGLPHEKNAHVDLTTFRSEPYMILEYFNKISDKTYKDDDIIVFNKKYVLYATDSKQLEEAFLRIEKANTILFAAERDCWPPDAAGCRKPSNDSISSYKYLHSGGWVARYNVARKFMQSYIRALESIKSLSDRFEQRALHQYTLNGAGKMDIQLDVDHNCTIFQTSSGSQLANWMWWQYPDGKDGPYMRSDGVIVNLETKSYPLLYHFNAGNDLIVSDAESLLWTKTKLLNLDYKNQCESYLKKYSQLNTCQERGPVKRIVSFYCDVVKIADMESQNYADNVKDISQRRNKSDINAVLKRNQINSNYLFPAHVPIFQVRKDPLTRKAVVRGRTKLLEIGKKHTLSDFKKILQCSRQQPELYGKGGALSLAKKIPLTRETIMLVAAHLESECTLWNGCRDVVQRYLNDGYPRTVIHHKVGGFRASKLFRIMNGTYYYDWPWGRHRIDGSRYNDNGRRIIKFVVNHVNDLKDSAFFYGGEMSSLPPGIPVPHFSSSPEASKSSDIPGAWAAAFEYESKRYELNNYHPVWWERELLLRGNITANERNNSGKSIEAGSINMNLGMIFGSNTTSKSIHCDADDEECISRMKNFATDDKRMTGLKGWNNRIDKGAFFGSVMNSYFTAQDHILARQVIMNLAIDHPEHLVANFTSINNALTGTRLSIAS